MAAASKNDIDDNGGKRRGMARKQRVAKAYVTWYSLFGVVT